ncbi:MAG: polysaccharide deacetylase family protein [Candidatus Acidiferrales bacterium]
MAKDYGELMDRRAFLRLVQESASVFVASNLLEAFPLSSGAQANTVKAPLSTKGRPQVALTMDDPNAYFESRMSWRDANKRILGALEARKLSAALFVCGKRVDQPEAKGLVAEWDDAGHLICNHSYSHLMFTDEAVSYSEFAADFLRNEPIIAPYRQRTRLFRYPFLKEGDTIEKRDHFRSLLKERQYNVGHVTIDGSDWYVDQRIRERMEKEPKANLDPYRDYVIAHLLDRAAFYRKLSVDVLGREISHTLLLHYSYMNALFLPAVFEAFDRAGWEWIDAHRAYEDPVFQRAPQILPAGESLVWALAKETGKFDAVLRYPGEDDRYEKPRMDALGL